MDGSATEYTYETTTPRLKKVKDPKNQEIHYQYYRDNLLQQVSYVNAQFTTPTVSFTYDAPYGRRATMVDGNGTTSYGYNPIPGGASPGAGQLASVDGPLANDTVSYTYDELGRVVSRTLNGNTSTWAYDALGRLTTQGDPIGTFTYAYVGITGRLQTLTYPNGQTSTYSYFPNSGDKRLQEIHHKKPGGATLSKFNYTYDTVGNIKVWTQQYESNPAQAYDLFYDAVDQLTAATLRTTDPTPVILKRYVYTYDPVGNRTTEQTDDAPTLSAYNNMNRLVNQSPGGALRFKGTLNEPATVTVQSKPAQVSADNKFEGSAQVTSGTNTVVVAATDPSGNLRTNTYQVSVSGTSKTFTHDSNGNMSANGTKAYEWNANNQLIRALDGGNEVAQFTYDGAGRRLQKAAGGVTRTYVYGGEHILEERLNTGGTVRYLHGPGIDWPLAHQDGGGVVSYYIGDHLRSIAQITSGTGTLLLTRQYDLFGNLVAGGSESGFSFTGREWDAETSLYYYRARYYSPQNAGFLSEDPQGLTAGVNFYSYVRANPIRYRDPWGLDSLEFSRGNGQLRQIDDNGNQVASWTATSGPFGNGPLPDGQYTTQAPVDVNANTNPRNWRSYCDPSGNCWFAPIGPDPPGRNGLGINPDGGVAGTEGCIGVQERDTTALRNFLRNNPRTVVNVVR
jgi:RHS repeat-associated protein